MKLDNRHWIPKLSRQESERRRLAAGEDLRRGNEAGRCRSEVRCTPLICLPLEQGASRLAFPHFSGIPLRSNVYSHLYPEFDVFPGATQKSIGISLKVEKNVP